MLDWYWRKIGVLGVYMTGFVGHSTVVRRVKGI